MEECNFSTARYSPEILAIMLGSRLCSRYPILEGGSKSLGPLALRSSSYDGRSDANEPPSSVTEAHKIKALKQVKTHRSSKRKHAVWPKYSGIVIIDISINVT